MNLSARFSRNSDSNPPSVSGVTSAAGFLTRKTHASLTAGSWYYCVFIDAATGLLFGMRRIQASA